MESSKESLKIWVNLYSNSLYTWALHKTSNKESAEDLVQDTFLTAHQQFTKFRGDSSPKTWLFAILNNKINEHFRKCFSQPYNQSSRLKDNMESSLFNKMFDSNDRWEDAEQPKNWREDEINLLDNVEFNATMDACLGKLPEHWRLAVQLKFIEQKKGELICQELDIAPTNFWQILHRAKLQLRKCLEINWFKL